MLTGRLVRVRHARHKIIPSYIDVDSATWRETAAQLLELFRGQEGRRRGELEEDIRETFGEAPGQLVHQGLAKLLEDRCEFEVVSGHPPEQLREAVFRAAAQQRVVSGQCSVVSQEHDTSSSSTTDHYSLTTGLDRAIILQQVATQLQLSPEVVEQGLFADLKSEQRLVHFKDINAERLLQRYNVALAQAVLLRSTAVQVIVRNEPPQRYRQLLRLVKFHRLVCDVKRLAPDSYQLQLDGPLSLFSATQKYGLQLALFLPAVLLCRDFDLRADLLWGPQRRPKTFTLSPDDGLVSHYPDSGMYVPAELAMFVELFRKKIDDWDISEESDIIPLGEGFWVPDLRLLHRLTGRVVYLEVLGFWRRSSAEKHLERLRQHVKEPFLLAVSDQLHVDNGLEGLPAGIHRFRAMPLPDEIARLAYEAVTTVPCKL